MKARCITNTLSSIIDPQLRAHIHEHVHQENIGLNLGETYWVHGVLFRSGVPWFYICDDVEAEYPKPYCSALFELLDSSIPFGWQLVPQLPTLLVPTEWASFPHFLEQLVDGNPNAVTVFQNLRQRSATPDSPSSTPRG
jgi:hypothetical protein